MILWVHETTLATKPEVATYKMKPGAAGFSELFNLLERTVEHKVNGIIMYVCKVYESALTIFWI
jgi:hypothetical protein